MKKMHKSSGVSAALPAPYRRLQAQLNQIGWMALGSVVERNKPGQGGPRYQWSRRVDKKTVTVALSAEQFAWLSQAIANQRKLWDILSQMQQLTLEYMWKHLPSTARRKNLSKKTLGLI
jgi:RNAse (barnase) inhibitor barstar